MAMTVDRAWPGVFTPAEAQRLSALNGPREDWRARQQLVKPAGAASSVIYLSQGFLARYRADRMGRRQMVGLHIPGDYVDLSICLTARTDHEIEAVGNASGSRIPCDTLTRLQSESPAMLMKLWRISQQDVALSHYCIFRLGRLTARERLANFLCETLVRLHARGLCNLDEFELPLTQADLSEICGMTAVHTNRMLGGLRQGDICRFEHGIVRVASFPQLMRAGQYSWDYLDLDPRIDQELRRQVGLTRR